MNNIIKTCDSTISFEKILFLLVLGYRNMTFEGKKKKKQNTYLKKKKKIIYEKTINDYIKIA